MDTRPGSGVPDPAAPRAPFPSSGAERPLGGLLRTLARDAAALLRQELALARAELRRNLRAAARGTVLVLTGGLTALLGVLVLLAALVLGVGGLLGGRYALGALLVGAALLLLGAGLAVAGTRKAKGTPLAPAETLASLRDTGAWARGEVSELRASLAAPSRPAEGGASSTGTLPAAETATRGEAEARGASGTAAAPLWKRVVRGVRADEVSSHAARVAYYFFLSLPPALMAVFGLTGLFGGRGTGDWLTEHLTTSLPPEASALVADFVTDIVHRDAPGPLSVGLLVALWAGSNVFGALEDTLNAAFGIPRRRSFVRRKLVSVGMLAACALLFLSGSAVLLGGGAISDGLGLGDAGRAFWAVMQVPLGFALVTATFWLIYYVLPNQDQRGRRGTLLRASALAGALFVLASLAFRLYMSHFGSHSATYGILGSVIVLLLWMYVTSLVILLGGEIASEMERTA